MRALETDADQLEDYHSIYQSITSRGPRVTTTDAEGQYRFTASSSEKLNVRVEKAGYSQPCRSAVPLTANSVMDVYIVADATLSVNGVPASMPVIQPTLSGNGL